MYQASWSNTYIWVLYGKDCGQDEQLRKNQHHVKENALCVQNIDTILGSKLNTIDIVFYYDML